MEWSHLATVVFFFQAEDGIRDADVTGVQTCALPIYSPAGRSGPGAGADIRDAGGRDRVSAHHAARIASQAGHRRNAIAVARTGPRGQLRGPAVGAGADANGRPPEHGEPYRGARHGGTHLAVVGDRLRGGRPAWGASR